MFYLYHEQLYRSVDAMRRIASQQITICGAGALGANIAESLARSGYRRLRVIDRDRIEERNLSTQPYTRADINSPKARVLANILYRAVGVEVEAHNTELTETNASKLLAGIVVDAFDNSSSRRLVKEVCARQGLACLHVGLGDAYAEAIWNEHYRVPSPSRDDVCDYPLARNLVILTASLACETLTRFIAIGAQEQYTITFSDFAVKRA